MPKSPAFGFPKRARLLRRAEFLAVRQQGKGFVDGPLAASFRAAAAGMQPAVTKVGLTVSSKVGGAVVRNQVKRRLREAVRHEFASLPFVELVLVARESATRASVADFRSWLRRASVRIAKGAGR